MTSKKNQGNFLHNPIVQLASISQNTPREPTIVFGEQKLVQETKNYLIHHSFIKLEIISTKEYLHSRSTISPFPICCSSNVSMSSGVTYPYLLSFKKIYPKKFGYLEYVLVLQLPKLLSIYSKRRIMNEKEKKQISCLPVSSDSPFET